LGHYDQTPTLSPDELVVLARLDQCIQQHHCRSQPTLRASLERLTCPLHDALTYLGLHPTHRQTAINALLQQMYRRHTAIWGWTAADWAAVLSTDLQHGCRFAAFASAYLLCGLRDLHLVATHLPSFAYRVFGRDRVDAAIEQLVAPLRTWGYQGRTQELLSGICSILLVNGSPELRDLTSALLERLQYEQVLPRYRWVVGAVSRALTVLGYLPAPLPARPTLDVDELARLRHKGVPADWAALCQRWYETSTLEPRTRRGVRSDLLRMGRWLAETHPTVTHPQAWTRELAAAFVAAVERMMRGAWATHPGATKDDAPAQASTKSGMLYSARTFFRDCQEWGWIAVRFNPAQCFTVSRAIRSAQITNPRVIADDVWAKLMHAGLNLTADDLPRNLPAAPSAMRYPLELVRAVAAVWLFAGLRHDEICRLRVGCNRWQSDGASVASAAPTQSMICLLEVPTNKTSSTFTKPVDGVVGTAIAAWEAVRPTQPPMVDRKTGERVSFLFSYRGHPLGKAYINRSLIPVLCAKAGVPEHDARGKITSHRARSTIVSQLYNAKEPMSLPELQAWLGHKHPNSTQHYTRISPTKLAQSYRDAGYFGRNVRTIEVLIDQDAVLKGDAAQGLPWKYYDLGHGYCTYDFFEQCEHRMACAQCAFYRPKDAFLELLREKQAHLLFMQQAIPLTEIEAATVDGDLVATARLIAQLTDRPTPAGPTPRDLWSESGEERVG
jgi:integrase